MTPDQSIVTIALPAHLVEPLLAGLDLGAMSCGLYRQPGAAVLSQIAGIVALAAKAAAEREQAGTRVPVAANTPATEGRPDKR